MFCLSLDTGGRHVGRIRSSGVLQDVAGSGACVRGVDTSSRACAWRRPQPPTTAPRRWRVVPRAQTTVSAGGVRRGVLEEPGGRSVGVQGVPSMATSLVAGLLSASSLLLQQKEEKEQEEQRRLERRQVVLDEFHAAVPLGLERLLKRWTMSRPHFPPGLGEEKRRRRGRRSFLELPLVMYTGKSMAAYVFWMTWGVHWSLLQVHSFVFFACAVRTWKSGFIILRAPVSGSPLCVCASPAGFRIF